MMNEIIKAMEERRSIRKFKPEMPPKAVLDQIIDAGLYAACGMGTQAAIIVAVTPDDAMLFVEQFRVPLQARTIEMPAGLVGDVHADESIELSAIRELEEETGYKAGKLTKLGSSNPNPALFSNHVHFFLAEDLTPTGTQHLDDDEFINYMELPIDEVIQGIGTSEFPHALMGTALALYFKHTQA